MHHHYMNNNYNCRNYIRRPESSETIGAPMASAGYKYIPDLHTEFRKQFGTYYYYSSNAPDGGRKVLYVVASANLVVVTGILQKFGEIICLLIRLPQAKPPLSYIHTNKTECMCIQAFFVYLIKNTW